MPDRLAQEQPYLARVLTIHFAMRIPTALKVVRVLASCLLTLAAVVSMKLIALCVEGTAGRMQNAALGIIRARQIATKCPTKWEAVSAEALRNAPQISAVAMSVSTAYAGVNARVIRIVALCPVPATQEIARAMASAPVLPQASHALTIQIA